jgi:hypothetical protein
LNLLTVARYGLDMNPVIARRRLSLAARRHLQERGLNLSFTGRLYLSFLLTKGALRLASGGPDRMATAEENVRILLDEAAPGPKAPAVGGTPAV